MRFSDYGSARDFFSAAREAAIDIERVGSMRERLAALEGIRGSKLAIAAKGSVSDPRAATDNRMDYEALTEGRVAEDREMVEAARKVIYGGSGHGGIAALSGKAFADVVYSRAVLAMPWKQVSATVGMSKRWCETAYSSAMDVVDAYGYDRCVSGEGIAEDCALGDSSRMRLGHSEHSSDSERFGTSDSPNDSASTNSASDSASPNSADS